MSSPCYIHECDLMIEAEALADSRLAEVIKSVKETWGDGNKTYTADVITNAETATEAINRMFKEVDCGLNISLLHEADGYYIVEFNQTEFYENSGFDEFLEKAASFLKGGFVIEDPDYNEWKRHDLIDGVVETSYTEQTPNQYVVFDKQGNYVGIIEENYKKKIDPLKYDLVSVCSQCIETKKEIEAGKFSAKGNDQEKDNKGR